MVCHHKKREDCEEVSFFRLGWVLMITNTCHKRRTTMEAQYEDKIKINTFRMYSVNNYKYDLYL